MRPVICSLVLISFLCLNVQAQDVKWPSSITLPSGKSYTGIVSVKPVGNGVRIIHQDGAATISYQDMAGKDRSAFGYDPAKVAQAEERDRKQQAAELALLKDCERLDAEKSAAFAKRKSALDALKARNYGGSGYWLSSSSFRLYYDAKAMESLTAGGYSAEDAKAIMARMKEEGRKQPVHLPKEFTQPQGQLRGVPSGMNMYKKKSNIRKFGEK